ncbi:chemotaxis protein CheW [Collibacillus ludicampi]|uniref:Chemotaxis protein CheW n=1 Tax=Collibacillus ludicampi TaxID=2771369 RepID=A0AAV4LD50_9BACL|nr:chemotaxis protein CheW [Collibacillus ludicampi]GIM45726.1 chemotaxis protein CheW [Collibacillus ludicampi]
MKLVLFEVGNETYALPIEKVRSIETVQPIRPVPLSPQHVLGVMNLRGVVITVMDLRTMLGAPAKELTPLNRLLIVDDKAYLVDEAHDVIDCDDEDIQSYETDNKYFKGVIRRGEKLVILIQL